MYFSKATGGFYSAEIHGDKMPNDCIEISESLYKTLLLEQASGKAIAVGDSGIPKVEDRPAPTSREVAIRKIAELESKITIRRLREAVLQTDGGWLNEIESQIKILRATL